MTTSDRPPSRLALMVRNAELKSASHGLAYPWWVPVASKWAQVLVITAAAAQRGLLWPPHIALVGVALVALPHALQARLTSWVPWWFTGPCIISGATIIMLAPVQGSTGLTVVVLGFASAEAIATDGVKPGLVVTAVSIPLAMAFSPLAHWAILGELGIGVGVGLLARTLSRTLVAERAVLESERAQAALSERQRIASEVHDLVAHSMSVTLLQLSGARRALLDNDIAEADAALSDAESVGRAAMLEIRRAVGLLANSGTKTAPLPHGGDIEALVATFEDAGLDVTLSIDGPIASVTEGRGLALYRIVQESLTNVARHGDGQPAVVRISVDHRRVHAVITSPLPPQDRSRSNSLFAERGVADGGGHGINGMMARARTLGGQLEVGPHGSLWKVELVLEAT